MNPIPYEPKENYLDEQGNRSIRVKGGKITYRGYTIVEKRDFGSSGHLIKGFMVSTGYVVTDGGIVNVLPGATWLQTVEDALRAIDDLIDSQRGFVVTEGEDPFWTLNRFRRNAEERAPELALLLQSLVSFIDENFDDLRERGIPDALHQSSQLLDRIDSNCDTRDTVVEVNGARRRVGPRQTGRFGVLPRNG